MQQDKKIIFRIGIDARFYGPIGKGLGRYTQEIVDGVIGLDTKNEYVVFLSPDNFDEFVPPHSRIKKVLADVRWYTLAEQFVMRRLIRKEGIDLMHFPHFNVPVLCPAKFVVTIHDLILTKFPTMRATTLGAFKYYLKNLGYRFVISRAVSRAEKVIAVSEYTKQDIMKHFSLPEGKIEMIYEGVATLGRSIDSAFAAKLKADEVLSDYCILEPYILYVGNAYPHKNLEALIRVFAKLHRHQPDLKLVVVGRDDYFYSRLKAYAATYDNDAIIFPGYVPDRELEILYVRASAYVFPSKYEGFGLPPLEAMARGCPVASSNATCLPEVLGGAALYFDPNDDEDMKRAISELLYSEDRRYELVRKGRERAKLYTWTEASKRTLAVYLSILAR